MPTGDTRTLAEVVRQLLAYRGWASPERLDASYRPERAPVGGATIRRIIDQTWGQDDELTLLRLAGMLRLPPRTLVTVRDGDLDALQRLEFLPDDAPVRQLIADLMQPPAKRRRRTGSG